MIGGVYNSLFLKGLGNTIRILGGRCVLVMRESWRWFMCLGVAWRYGADLGRWDVLRWTFIKILVE